MKKISFRSLPFLLVLLPFVSCATSQKQDGQSSMPQHLIQQETPKQTPSLVKTIPAQASPEPSMPVTSINNELILLQLSSIESAFIQQNCDKVIESTKELLKLNPKMVLSEQPPVVQGAIYTCDGKSGLSDPNRVQQAIANLKSLSLKYPLINEAWLHNTIADFYLNLNDIPNGLAEKKQTRDLLLAQQQDISALNAEIAKLDPSAASNNGKAPTQLSTALTEDQIIASINQFINNDSPEQAIALIDSLSVDQKTDNIKRLRNEAVHTLVTNLRFRVRALMLRSIQQTGQAKKDTLVQCEQILKGIIQNYPDYQDMPSVLTNLRKVESEINKI